MPRSKRNKLVTLSKVKTGGKERKERLIAKVRKAAEKYQSLFVFRMSNSRSQIVHDLRDTWADSKIFFGKNKVMQVALGRSAADEHADKLHRVSGRLVGQCMLLFSNRDRAEVEEFFSSFEAADFARMGMLVTQDVWVRAGPLEQFAHSQEPYLRSLGLPTRLHKAVVTLERDARLCEKGNRLTAEQAKLLKAFGMQLAQATFALDCVWSGGHFDQVGSMDLGEDEEEEEEEDEEEGGDEMQQGEDEEEEQVEQPKKGKKSNKSNTTQKFVFVRE